jgi:hypothetical protein
MGGTSGEKMSDWVSALPLQPGGNLSWACAGEPLSLDEAASARPQDYCDVALVDRVIVMAP